MNGLLIFLAACSAPCLLILHVWRKDCFNPEPKKEIKRAFTYGIMVALLCILVEMLITSIDCSSEFLTDNPQTILSSILTAFGVAAIPEEGLKLLALWIFLRKNQNFDEHIDGIVYSVALSMGFAATENVGYLIASVNDNLPLTIVLRSFFAVPGHYMFAVAMGYFVSLAHFKKSTKYYILSFVIPAFIHGLYDSVAFMMRVERQYALLLFALFVALIIFFLIKSSRAISKHLVNDIVNNQKLMKPTNDEQQ